MVLGPRSPGEFLKCTDRHFCFPQFCLAPRTVGSGIQNGGLGTGEKRGQPVGGVLPRLALVGSAVPVFLPRMDFVENPRSLFGQIIALTFQARQTLAGGRIGGLAAELFGFASLENGI